MRRILIGVSALAILLGVAHTLVWRWAEAQLAAGLSDWTAARRAEGWTVSTGSLARGGWPLHAELAVSELFLSGGAPDLPGGLTWSADRIVLAVALWRPSRLVIHFDGLGRLRLGEGADIPYTADRLTATVPLDPGVPPRSVDLDGANFRLGLPQGGLAANPLTLGLLSLHLDARSAATQGEPAVAFAASAEDVALPPPPPGPGWPLGPRIASASVEGAVTGPMPRATDPASRAAQWRDGGGTLEVRHLALGWGPLGLSASATLALDEKLQPMGAASAHLIGADAALDALAASHAIAPAAAATARAMLMLSARVPEGGGAPQLDLPLTVQNRVVSMGRIPLGRVPAWTWPAAAH